MRTTTEDFVQYRLLPFLVLALLPLLIIASSALNAPLVGVVFAYIWAELAIFWLIMYSNS